MVPLHCEHQAILRHPLSEASFRTILQAPPHCPWQNCLLCKMSRWAPNRTAQARWRKRRQHWIKLYPSKSLDIIWSANMLWLDPLHNKCSQQKMIPAQDPLRKSGNQWTSFNGMISIEIQIWTSKYVQNTTTEPTKISTIVKWIPKLCFCLTKNHMFSTLQILRWIMTA